MPEAERETKRDSENSAALAKHIRHELGSFRLGLKTIMQKLGTEESSIPEACELWEALLPKMDQILGNLKSISQTPGNPDVNQQNGFKQ